MPVASARLDDEAVAFTRDHRPVAGCSETSDADRDDLQEREHEGHGEDEEADVIELLLIDGVALFNAKFGEEKRQTGRDGDPRCAESAEQLNADQRRVLGLSRLHHTRNRSALDVVERRAQDHCQHADFDSSVSGPAGMRPPPSRATTCNAIKYASLKQAGNSQQVPAGTVSRFHTCR